MSAERIPSIQEAVTNKYGSTETDKRHLFKVAPPTSLKLEVELQKQLQSLTEVLNKCGHLLNKGGGVDVSTELVTMQRLLPIPRERIDKLMNY